jgi:hypothetical protein
MGDTRDEGRQQADAPETPTTSSSILGQAPFKLDLRVVPRQPNQTASAQSTGDVVRLKPVDRELLPEPQVAQVIELPTAAEPSGAPTLVALASPPAGAPPLPPPPTAPVIVAPGTSIPMPTVVAPAFASRAVPAAGSLTLAPIAPKVADATPRPIDFNAILGSQVLPKRRKQRRNPLGLLFKLALLGGLIYGGVWAVKKYVLAPKWDKEVKAFADAVADRRGLDWDEAVEVVALTPEAYALELASSVLGVTSTDAPSLGSEWRAMGLAEGGFDLAEIGKAATPDQPAFYDPTDGKIYELAGLSTELRGIALSRALTMALLDQHYDWAEQAATGPGVGLGVRALFDGDASAVQAETTLTALIDPAHVAVVSNEIDALRLAAVDAAIHASPYGVALAGPAAEATSHLFSGATTALDRNRSEQLPVFSDASVFDAERGRASRPELLAAPGAKSVGMMYWYYALAGRIGSDAAWAAAVHWNGDSVSIEHTGVTSFCVTAKIQATDQVGQWKMLDAFNMWAALAPAAANTTVEPADDNQLTVRSCDPTATASTIESAEIRLFGNAPTELTVVSGMVSAGLADNGDATACVVRSLREGKTIPVTEPLGVDRALTTATADVGTPEAASIIEACQGA